MQYQHYIENLKLLLVSNLLNGKLKLYAVCVFLLQNYFLNLIFCVFFGTCNFHSLQATSSMLSRCLICINCYFSLSFSLQYSRGDVVTSPAADVKSIEPFLWSFLPSLGVLLVDLEYVWSYSRWTSSSSTASFSFELYCEHSWLISNSLILCVSCKKYN